MYALTFIYEGVDDNAPYANTIAVSEDKSKLIDLMHDCVDNDTLLPNTDDDECAEWSDDINYAVYRDYNDEIVLQHRKRINLYTRYIVRSVEVI